jgi:hypothetical protein
MRQHYKILSTVQLFFTSPFIPAWFNPLITKVLLLQHVPAVHLRNVRAFYKVQETKI